MPHSYGYRARTRHLFSKNFREHGQVKLSTYMINYKVGDLVDIKANGSVHKGMPHKFYHGKTGVVYNVTKSAVGVIVHKQVNGRYMEKRINLRVEHVLPSKCRQDYLDRIKEYARLRAEAKAAGKEVVLKRLPKQPLTAHVVSTKDNAPLLVRPIPYESLI